MSLILHKHLNTTEAMSSHQLPVQGDVMLRAKTPEKYTCKSRKTRQPIHIICNRLNQPIIDGRQLCQCTLCNDGKQCIGDQMGTLFFKG